MICIGPQHKRIQNYHLSLPYYTQRPEVLTKNDVETSVKVGDYWIVCLGNTEKAFSCGSAILSVTALLI